jgi:hypothetical protein
MHRAIALLGILAALAAAAQAAGERPEVRVLTLSPAPEPVPALRHALLPRRPELRPGNAAPLYLRSSLLAVQVDEAATQGIAEWASAPMADVPADDAGEALAAYADALYEAKTAARRTRCEWELDLSRGFGTLLPDLAHCRSVGRAIMLQARLQIADGRYEEAMETLQTGFAMARDVARGGTLIHGLVGVAVGELMLQAVEEWVDSDGAPNLYWALAALPDPPVDLRPGLDTELSLVDTLAPCLADPLGASLDADGWREQLVPLLRTFGAGDTDHAQKILTGVAVATYEDARGHVRRQGYTDEEVDAMPVLQVVAAYMTDWHRRIRDDLFKWFYVPYPEAVAGFRSSEEQLEEVRGELYGVLPAMLLPALRRAYEASVSLERRVAALRCVEAVRMHAAAHDGELPASLDDVDCVPVPLDPMTARPFVYSLAEATATLSSPPVEGERPRCAVRYELKVARQPGTEE